ncbi:hypothetical protein CDD83_5438 [Cordyceps sp. RAO-2017]|nr:hypothetical protein CDD83_5438 [Cordyceps sp. RAO-2017]
MRLLRPLSSCGREGVSPAMRRRPNDACWPGHELGAGGPAPPRERATDSYQFDRSGSPWLRIASGSLPSVVSLPSPPPPPAGARHIGLNSPPAFDTWPLGHRYTHSQRNGRGRDGRRGHSM